MDCEGSPAAGMDEIEQGSEQDPWQPPRLSGPVRTALLLLAGVVVGALGWQELARSGGGTQPSPRPGAAAQVPAPELTAQQICEYVDGSLLEVSFQLTNVGAGPVRVVAVRPDLPLPGMLRSTGVELAGGHCGPAPAAPPGNGPLEPGRSIPVTLSFRILVACPQPAPVQAAVDVAGSFPDATLAVPLLPDLGQVSFPHCTTP